MRQAAGRPGDASVWMIPGCSVWGHQLQSAGGQDHLRHRLQRPLHGRVRPEQSGDLCKGYGPHGMSQCSPGHAVCNFSHTAQEFFFVAAPDDALLGALSTELYGEPSGVAAVCPSDDFDPEENDGISAGAASRRQLMSGPGDASVWMIPGCSDCVPRLQCAVDQGHLRHRI